MGLLYARSLASKGCQGEAKPLFIEILFHSSASHKPNSNTSFRKWKVGTGDFLFLEVSNKEKKNNNTSTWATATHDLEKLGEKQKRETTKTMDVSRTAGVSKIKDVAAHGNI